MGFKESLKSFALGAGMLAAGAGVAEAKSAHTPDTARNKAGVENLESPQDHFIQSVISEATHGFDVKNPALLDKAKDIMKKNLSQADLDAGDFAIHSFADSLREKLKQRGAIVEHVKPGQVTGEQLKSILENAPQFQGEPDLEATRLDGNIFVGDGFIATKVAVGENLRNMNLQSSVARLKLDTYAKTHNLVLGLNNSTMVKNDELYIYVAAR